MNSAKQWHQQMWQCDVLQDALIRNHQLPVPAAAMPHQPHHLETWTPRHRRRRCCYSDRPIPKLQTYDGSVDPRMWMYNCKMRLELGHIAEIDWHKWLLSILTGPAQSYAYYECTDAYKTTWVTLYEALKRRVCNKYDDSLARDKLEFFRLQNLRRGYARYLQKFREICSQCQLPISAYDQSRYFI